MSPGCLRLFLGAGRLPAARCRLPSHSSHSSHSSPTMSSSNLEGWQPPRKARHKEPLRRVKCKENRSRRPDANGPSTVYLQVLGAGSRDNPASVYVFSEFNR